MRIYKSGSQVIIAEENGNELFSNTVTETAMTLYENTVSIDKGQNGRQIIRIAYTSVLDEDGVSVGDKSAVINYLSAFIGSNIVTSTQDDALYVVYPQDKLVSDAWGRPKAVIDKSIFHGMFTYNVPVNTWCERLNGTELTAFSNASSVNGALELVSGTTLNRS